MPAGFSATRAVRSRRRSQSAMKADGVTILRLSTFSLHLLDGHRAARRFANRIQIFLRGCHIDAPRVAK
jgi:hypothetical protein